MIKGILEPDDSVNISSNKRRNYQLGLFDDLDEFAEVSRFSKLGFSDKFLGHPVLKLQKLSESGAQFLYEIYKLFKRHEKYLKASHDDK